MDRSSAYTSKLIATCSIIASRMHMSDFVSRAIDTNGLMEGLGTRGSTNSESYQNEPRVPSINVINKMHIDRQIACLVVRDKLSQGQPSRGRLTAHKTSAHKA